MKNLRLCLAAAISIALTACDENMEPAPHSTVPIQLQFETSELQVSESANELDVVLVLNKATQKDAIISVDVISQGSQFFETNPAAMNGKINLTIGKGGRSAFSKIKPINNEWMDGQRDVVFKIGQVDKNLIIGSRREINVMVLDDEVASKVNFTAKESVTYEDNANGHVIELQLTQPAAGNAQLEISLESEDAVYGEHYTTFPQAINGKLLITLLPGAEKTEIKIFPMNNSRIQGTRHLALIMAKASGAVAKGEVDGHGLTLNDDELRGISRSYSVVGGGWGLKKYFGFTEDGLISKIYWEQQTPYVTSGNYLYEYNANRQVVKMTDGNNSETNYLYENGRIIKSEKYTNGALKEYTFYGYDEAGNVGEVMYYYRQPDGEFKAGLLFVYLYYQNGNLYKRLTYNPAIDDEPYLISTHTYEDYLAASNPFSMEILPNKAIQPNLPISYSVEEHGKNMHYSFSYEFDTDGRVRKRITFFARWRY